MRAESYRYLSTVGLVVLGVAWPQLAQAFSYLSCGTTPVKRASTPITLIRDTGSIAGTRALDLAYSIDRWNAVVRITPPFGPLGQAANAESIPPVSDATNTVWASPSADNPGYNGMNFNFWNQATCNPTVQIVESDLWIANNVGLLQGDVVCDAPGTAQRTTFVHELGHALGLEHESSNMAVMMTSSGIFKYCEPGLGINLAPDDASGGRSLYPGLGTSRADLAAMPWERDGADATSFVDIVGSTTPCPGDTVQFEWTVGNLGNISTMYDVRFYLSTDKSITTTDVVLGTATGGLSVFGGFSKFTTTVTLPSSTPRNSVRYYGWILDFNNGVTEPDEFNNAAFVPRAIRTCT